MVVHQVVFVITSTTIETLFARLLLMVAAASAKSPTLARFASVGFNRTIFEKCNYLTPNDILCWATCEDSLDFGKHPLQLC